MTIDEWSGAQTDATPIRHAGAGLARDDLSDSVGALPRVPQCLNLYFWHSVWLRRAGVHLARPALPANPPLIARHRERLELLGRAERAQAWRPQLLQLGAPGLRPTRRHASAR